MPNLQTNWSPMSLSSFLSRPACVLPHCFMPQRNYSLEVIWPTLSWHRPSACYCKCIGAKVGSSSLRHESTINLNRSMESTNLWIRKAVRCDRSSALGQRSLIFKAGYLAQVLLKLWSLNLSTASNLQGGNHQCYVAQASRAASLVVAQTLCRFRFT